MRERVAEPRLALLALVVLLSGCAALTAPGPAAPESTRLPVLAASRSASLQPGLAIDRWWTVFADPALERLIDAALAHNHDLAAAAARVNEARARLDEVRGTQAPSLDLQAHGSRARQSGDGALPPGADRTGGSHGVALAGRYELDLWGRLAAGSDAARQRLLAQEWARAALEWSLSAQVAESHFMLRAVQRQIQIGEAVRDSRAATLRLRQREHAAGAGNEFDLRRAQAEWAGTETTLAGLQRQRVALERSQALLVGRAVRDIVDVEPAREALDTGRAFGAVLPQGAAADLLVRRPDVRQAEAQLAAARADITAARAATLPSISLTGSVGSDVRSISNLFNGPGFVWSLAASATQSVLDGGKAEARVREADARAEAALADYRKVVVAAVLELREAYAALDITQQAHQAERERVSALERARSIAQLGFENGALAYLELLDAERNTFQAQLSEVTAYRDRLIGQVAAFKALGGGYLSPDLRAQAQPR